MQSLLFWICQVSGTKKKNQEECLSLNNKQIKIIMKNKKEAPPAKKGDEKKKPEEKAPKSPDKSSKALVPVKPKKVRSRHEVL